MTRVAEAPVPYDPAALPVVVDSVILIDYLNGIPHARAELARHRAPAISIITRMEVLVGCADAAEVGVVEGFLAGFTTVPLDGAVAAEAVRLRRERRLRLPDAIVYATARCRSAVLVTRNERDFPTAWPDVRIPYRL